MVSILTHLQLDKLKHRLLRWHEITEKEFPGRYDLLELIPKSDSINIDKLGHRGTITTDTCNAAQKVRRLLVEHINGHINEQDCMQHLRNVWINGVAKSVNKFMSDYLEDSLEEISSFLRVSPDLAHVIRAFHKEFSLTANYPKGHGEKFRDWMIKRYPKEFLMHAERASGSRQDLITLGAGPIYWNRQFNVEFLDDVLRVRGASNILQENLFTILSSLEMIASTRFFAILQLAICLPFRWLTGNTHKLAHRNWGARSMGRAVDLIHSACNDIIDDIALIHDESYMLHIFDELLIDLPEFKAFMDYEFKNKMSEFVQASQTKAVPLKELIKELFEPTNQDNQDSIEMLEKIAVIGIQVLIGELEDQSKATYKYLSISGSEFSYEHCPDEVKQSMLHTSAANDLAESSFAGVTAHVQCYGRIGMCAAAAVSDVARNGFLSRGSTNKQINRTTTSTKKQQKAKKRGLYHGLPKELQVTLVMMCMEDSPATRKSNNDNLERSRLWRAQKEEMAKLKGLEDAEDEFIESLIYHKMWNSDACWKTSREVSEGLRRIKTKSGKYASLKDNIRIRWKGLGWMECETRWTVDGHELTVPELASRLKKLIKMQHKQKWVVPELPTVMVPQRKNIVFMGTATRQVTELDKKAKEGEADIEKRARVNWKKREAQGFGSVHSNMQQPYAPNLEDLIGEKISYYCNVDMDEAGTTKDAIWMNGTVCRVSDGTWLLNERSKTRCHPKGEAAEILFDAVPSINYVAGKEIVGLKPNLWNKDKVGAWCKYLGKIDYGTK